MLNEAMRFAIYRQQNPHELSPQQFSALERELEKPKKNEFTDQYVDYLFWSMGLPSRQEIFANFIAKRLTKHAGAKVLEVGCGQTARMSRFLSEKGFEMTCIDPILDLSYTKNLERVKGIKSKFEHHKFDLTEYDYVVAQEPCDATEHVVRACIAQNKPFMMSLCGVPHKLLSGKMPKDRNEWHHYLLSIFKEDMKLIYCSLDPILTTPILRSNQF